MLYDHNFLSYYYFKEANLRPHPHVSNEELVLLFSNR